MAESMTGENSPDNVHMQTVSRGRSKCPWCGLKIQHLGEILRFFHRDHLKARSETLKVIRAMMQCSLARTGVI